jgi:hypothetical protein
MDITIAQLTVFLGWASLINIGLLLFSTLMVVLCRDWAVGIHSKMFNLDPATVPKMYFEYLGQYKVLVLVFNVVPYIALRVIG